MSALKERLRLSKLFEGLSRPEVAVNMTDRSEKYRCAWLSAVARARRMKVRSDRVEKALDVALMTLRQYAREHGYAAEHLKKGMTLEDASVAYSVSAELRRIVQQLEEAVDGAVDGTDED